MILSSELVLLATSTNGIIKQATMLVKVQTQAQNQ